MRQRKRIAVAVLLLLTLAGCTAQRSPQDEQLILLGASTGGYVAGRAGAILIAEKGTETDLETVGAVMNGIAAILGSDGFAPADLQKQLDALPYGIGQDIGFVLQRWAPIALSYIDRNSLEFRVVAAAMDGFGVAFQSPTSGLHMATAGRASSVAQPVPQTVSELRAMLRR